LRVQGSGAGGPHQHHRLRPVAAALLLAGAAIPAEMAVAAAAAAQTSQEDQNRPIIVNAPLFRDIQPERQLDPDAIESYGVSTIDELVGEVQTELGEEAEEPLILVNGQRVNDLSEIGAFPVEVLNNMQVLPRGSAVALGGRPGQRVISLSLKHAARTATLTGAHKLATDGDWNSDRGEGILTDVHGNRRANLTLRARDDSVLLESDRDIIQPAPRLPYALTGNVIGYPNTSGEIDPVLSALAGQVVTVAPIPATATPTLADFAAHANQPAFTDLGQFRTLRPHARNYDLNATYATPLAHWLTANATLRLNRNVSQSQRGLPGALFVLLPTNPFSPFSTDVGLAFYGPDALRSRSRNQGGEGDLTLNGQLGSWTVNWNSKHQRSNSLTKSERQSVSTITIADDVNPFATDLTDLITITTDRFSSKSRTTESQIIANGPFGDLPAGPLIATIEGRLAWNHLDSETVFGGINDARNFRRSEQSVRGALDIPLTSRDGPFLPGLGDIDANIEYGRAHYSDAGSVSHHAFELNWQPNSALRLTGSLQSNETPPTVELLGAPVTVIPGVRTFDPLTGNTVDVTQITGGNPNLLPQKTKIKRLSALWRLVPKWNLQLNAEYTDTDRQNFVSSLPEASAAVSLAFPERFIRDANGVLTVVDLRPVNFDSDREKRLRWGFTMNRTLSKTPATQPVKSGGRRVPPPPRTYFQLTANHTMVFSEEIVIRPGLPPVDLLHGGAVGIAGGRVRHQLDGTAAINSGGTGARIGVIWRGKSELDSRINGVRDTLDFSPVLLVNARAFTDLKRFLPESKWARGFRISLDAINIFNDRQEVRDSHGNTPLQYQPAYRDPIGRTIEIEFRKVF
jgi:iron complex outermembrane recepter protein